MQEKTLAILIVDDQEDQFHLITSFLNAADNKGRYRVEWAATYERALEAVQYETFDVCLIDYNLGERSGLELLLEIQASSYKAALMLMTGASSLEIDLEAMRFGAVDYIDKTELRPDTLERTIRYAVMQRQAILREQRQKQFAEALLDTVAILNSTLEFDEILDHILANLNEVIPHDMANIMLIQGGYTHVIGHSGYNSKQLADYISNARFSVESTPSYRQMLDTRLPYLVANVSDDVNWQSSLESDYIQSYLGVPILAGDEVIGFINLDSLEPGFFEPSHLRHAVAFANHIAIAIQNAKAYEQAQTLAALEERQRLARDLHDAVSQTLFSANVIAETLPHVWNQSPDDVPGYLATLGRLTKGALAEMRSLLLELRPTALQETEFNTLLNNLIQAFRSRTETEISLTYNGDVDVYLPTVKVTLYRVIQEALNNITKHAKAKHVRVIIDANPTQVKLFVQDDGMGFRPMDVAGNHLGLKIMQERVDNVGGTLEIQSELHQGTEVSVVLMSDDVKR